jgi:hypothetical protein
VAAKIGEHVALKAADNLVPMAGGFGVEVACNPVARHDFEGIGSQRQRTGLVGLLDGARVASIGKVALGFVASITRLFLRIPANVTADSGNVTGIAVNVTEGRYCAF